MEHRNSFGHAIVLRVHSDGRRGRRKGDNPPPKSPKFKTYKESPLVDVVMRRWEKSHNFTHPLAAEPFIVAPKPLDERDDGIRYGSGCWKNGGENETN